MASGVDRAYYPTTVLRRLCGIHWYLNICVSAMDVVQDIDTITIVLANDYAKDYESWISKKANLAEMEITIRSLPRIAGAPGKRNS